MVIALGFVIQFCPVRTPEFKAGIERAIGTLESSFFHTLPGTTFSGPIYRRDYDSLKEACIYLSEIDRLLVHYFVDQYAETPHRGLGAIPARAWERKVAEGFMPRLPSSPEQLHILLGRTESRCLQHYGIDLHSLRYQSSELGPLRARLDRESRTRGKAVKVKWFPGDLSRVYVFDPYERRYIEVPVDPAAQEYVHHLSWWKHRVIRRAVLAIGDKVDLAALGRSKKHIQELVDASRNRQKANLRSRKRAARWETSGRSAREMARQETTMPVEPSVLVTSPEPEPTVPSPTPLPALPKSIDHSEWEIAPAPVRSSRST